MIFCILRLGHSDTKSFGTIDVQASHGWKARGGTLCLRGLASPRAGCRLSTRLFHWVGFRRSWEWPTWLGGSPLEKNLIQETKSTFTNRTLGTHEHRRTRGSARQQRIALDWLSRQWGANLLRSCCHAEMGNEVREEYP